MKRETGAQSGDLPRIKVGLQKIKILLLQTIEGHIYCRYHPADAYRQTESSLPCSDGGNTPLFSKYTISTRAKINGIQHLSKASRLERCSSR